MPLALGRYAGLGQLGLTLDRRGLAWTGLVVAVFAFAGDLIATRYDEVAAALVFMLGVTIAGAVGGLVCAIITAAAAFLIFNFFVTEPALTFRLATGRDLAPLVIFNLCAIVTGVLAGRLRDRSRMARASNAQLTNLLTLSRELQSAARVSDIVAALDRATDPALRNGVTLFRADRGAVEHLGPPSRDQHAVDLAARALREEHSTQAAGALTAVRLHGSGGPVGVMVMNGAQRDGVDRPFVKAVGGMVALALERALLSEQVAERRAAMQAEELKTALLSSVSHDFRTPLTAISASASTLLVYGDKLDQDVSQRFLQQIVDDCDRLNRYTANLLEMSRLEAGGVPASSQTLSAAEMVGVAVQRVRARAGSRRLRIHAPVPDLAVAANPALFELVLINVLDNAILYSADGTRVVVTVVRDAGWCRIGIADEGCGIPAANLERVFERFYRVPRSEASPQGSGLGLAIAKGFVEALGGAIEARTPGVDGAGTEIVITLPVAQGFVDV